MDGFPFSTRKVGSSMGKRVFSMSSMLAVLLIFAQLVFPLANALASSNNMLPPSNLAAQLVTPDDVKLSWSSVFGATGYKVYEIKEGQLLVHGTASTTSYALNNLPEGSYTYAVSTLSSEGESGPSAPITVDIVYPEMAAPESLTYTIQKGNDIVLSWTASQYAENYNIYQTTADGQKTLLSSVTGRTYTISNALEGTYTYTVSAANSLYGESPISSAVTVDVVHPVMTAPGNLTHTVTNGSDVDLKWAAVSYATAYKIYQIVDGEKVLKSTVTTTSAKLSNVPAGDYVYQVHSYSDRFGESAEGSQVSVTVSEVTMTAPSNLTYKLQNVNDIVLSWSSAANATNYKVYQMIDGQKVLKSTVTTTTVSYTNMPAGNYTFVVHSNSDRFGESAEGSQVSLTIDEVIMAAPGNFTYTILNGNDIALKWESVLNANSYKIYQIVDGKKVLKSTLTGTSATYANLPAGDYVYEVYSYSTRFGESAEGSQVSLTLVHPTMQPPADLTQTVKSTSSFSLSWTASEYAASYKVYQIVDGQRLLKSTVAGTSLTYSNVPPGDYIYEVYSYSSRFGESAVGSRVTVIMNGQTMEAPTNLTYTITNGNDITLKWTGVSSANNYRVYLVVDGQKVLKGTTTGTAVAFTNLPEGEYQYVVHSYSTLFDESPEGAQVAISLVHPEMAAPSNLAYKIINGNDVVLSWTGVQYATSYKVYEIVDGGKILKNTVTTLSAAIAKVPVGEHTYIVHAVSSRFGESAEGGSITLTMQEHFMEAPGNLTHTITNGNDITLKWNTVTYATAYRIYQIIDGESVLKKTVTTTSVVFPNLPEGDYTFVVYSYSDRFGESPEGSSLSTEIVFPIMQAPVNLTQSIVNGNDIVLKWTASAYAKSYNIYQVVDGQKVLKRTVASISAVFVNMPEGDYTYEVYSYSDRFGESPEGSDVSLTLVFPTMQPPVNLTKSITNGNDITLRWNASTYATAYNVYQIAEGKKALARTVTTTVAGFANMPEGDYTYEVHSVSSRFGESPSASKIEFSLVWPVVQAPVITGTVFNANNITLSWKGVAWANEYRVYEVSGDARKLIYKGTALSTKIYNLSEDTHSYEMTAFSTRFGESVPSNRVIENIVYPVMQPPVAKLTLLSETSARILWNFVTYANGYNVYELIDGKPVLVAEKVNNLSYTINDLSYANHQYYVTSVSNSFGQSVPSNVVEAILIIDTEAPVTRANSPTGWVNGEEVTVSLTATDNETGVAATYYSVGGSAYIEGTAVTVREEGITEVSFYSVDQVGNKEAVQSIQVKIDRTAPVTVSDAPTGWSKDEVTVNLSATDAASGVDAIYYSLNGSAYTAGTAINVTEEGVNEIRFYAVDAAGNKEAEGSAQVKIDRTAPLLVWEGKNEYALGTTLEVNYAASDDLSGIVSDSMILTMPGETTGAVVDNGSSIALDKPGVYKVQITATNGSGLSTTIEKHFTVYIVATIEVTPKVIKGNKGIFTVRVTLPSGYSSNGFQLDTATVNDVKALASNNGYYNQAKLGQFKFERSDFEWNGSEAVLQFRGYVDGNLVIGQTTVTLQK
jgi:fibronectin type 3 domain-containing protein